MMLYPAMNELLEQVPSRYKLVNVVAARARQIANDADYADEMLDDKPVSIAIREIAEGKVPDLTAPEEPTAMEAAFREAQASQAEEESPAEGEAEAPEPGEAPAEEEPETSDEL